MKEIRITRMELLNFKGIRNLVVDFDLGETNIRGANATGKTSVFDAFTWVLFGKDSAGRTDFNLKTLDADGHAIERLPHEVIVWLEVSGETVKLKKSLVENWVKKRGTQEETYTGNTIECYFNEVPCTAREYNAKVAELCSEEVFKLITNPLFFTSQKRDVQRAFLIRMAGNVTDEEVAGGNGDFTELVAQLSGKTMEELRREVQSKKRKIKEQVESIPARIDERKRDIPEEKDWAQMEAEIAELKHDIGVMDDEMGDIVKASEEAIAAKRKAMGEVTDLQMKIASRESELKSAALQGYYEQKRAYDNGRMKIQRLTADRRVVKNVVQQAEAELVKLNKRREELLGEWRAIKAETFEEPDRGNFICPTCKRPLEAEDVDARIEEMRRSFNAAKAERLERNKCRGVEVKEAIEAKTAELQSARRNQFDMSNELTELEVSMAGDSEPKEPDVSPTLESDPTLKELREQLRKAQEACDGIKAELPNTTALKECKRETQQRIDALTNQLRERDIIEATKRRIEDLEREYSAAQAELARLEGVEYNIAQFGKAKMNMLEGRINGMFRVVKWKMYNTLINGGEEETCEAMVGGVPFGSLNSAMQINAGMDIINTICQAEGVSAPVFIDNRESVTDLLPVRTQLINLIVDANCETLKIG